MAKPDSRLIGPGGSRDAVTKETETEVAATVLLEAAITSTVTKETVASVKVQPRMWRQVGRPHLVRNVRIIAFWRSAG